MKIYNQKKGNDSLTSMIFNKLRDDILNNKYCCGERIIVAKLADELFVSQAPVREALKLLSMDGLVDDIPNTGFFIKAISDQDMIDICMIRNVFEVLAVRWAIERIDESGLKKLTDIYNLMEFYTYKKNVNKILELDKKFHEIIYIAMKSRFIEHKLLDFHLLITSPRLLSLKNEGRIYETLEEHRCILEAIIERDVEKAVRHMIEHCTALKHVIDS